MSSLRLLRYRRALWLSALPLLLSLSLAVHAQKCSDWAKVTSWKGSYTLVGNGTFTTGDLIYTINQTSGADINFATTGNSCPGPLEWFAADTNYAGVLNDTLLNTTLGCITDTVVGSSGVSNSFLNLDFTTGTFSVLAVPAENWDQTTDNCGGKVQHMSGANYPMYSVTLWPLKFALPATVQPLKVSNFVFQDQAFFEGGSATVPWTLNITLTPTIGDTPEETVDDPCKKSGGSSIACQNQSLGEDVTLVGTGFFLHYEGDRAPGRSGANSIASNDAHMIGGWTLNVHHVFDHAGATLFMGDGSQRSAWQIGAPVSFSGNNLLTSDDGNEVYVFDGASGRHLQTLTPISGALKYQFGYDLGGNLVTITDATGNITTIQRDSSERAKAIVSPFSQTTKLVLDGNGFLKQITDPAGRADKFTNASTGLITARTDANGNKYLYAYDSEGRLASDSDSIGGSITVNRANSNSGYDVTTTTALGRTTTFLVTTPTSPGEQLTNTWPNGLQATTTNTQQNGQLVETNVLPDGTSISNTMGPDPRWGLQAPVSLSNVITLGNLAMTIKGTRTATLSVAANPFSLTTQTDTEKVNGRVYTSVFTASTKTNVDTTPVKRKITTVLDSLDRVASTQLGQLEPMQFTYDSRGRISAIKQATRTTTVTYDAKGFVSSVTDPLQLTTKYTRDADGRTLTTTLPDNRVIKYAYDKNGNLTAVTPPGSSAHSFSYNAVDMPSAYKPPTVPGAGATTYSYDNDRDLTTVTRPDGTTINYSYDSAGRLSGLTVPGETISFAYDSGTGNLNSSSISGGEALAYAYNGPLLTSNTWTGTVAGSVSRVYDNNFWVISQSLNGSNKVAFSHDKDGLLTKAGTMVVKRDPKDGAITGTTLTNLVEGRTYDTFGDLTGYTLKNKAAVLDAVQLTRDANGRISARTETIGGVKNVYGYNYDAAGRLISVVVNGVTPAAYTYDSNSNRLTATTASGTTHATYDAQDRLLSYGNTSYAYTGNGELLSQTIGSQVTSYSYDAFGSLISAVLPNGTALAYITDAEHNRVGKKVNGVLKLGFLYDGDRIVAQLNGSNAIVSQFVYGSGANVPDYMLSGGVTYRIFSDHLGSPRLVANATTGAIAQQLDYDEFGNIIQDSNPGFQPFAFAGGLYDPDTKLLRFGSRDYSPAIGRWTSKDPIRFDAGDTNLYGYVVNDPINMIDPSGLSGDDCSCSAKGVKEKLKQMVSNPDMQEASRATAKNTQKIVKGTWDALTKKDAIGKAKGLVSIVDAFGDQLKVIDKATKKFGTPKACPPIPHITDLVSTTPSAPEGMTPILRQYPNQ